MISSWFVTTQVAIHGAATCPRDRYLGPERNGFHQPAAVPACPRRLLTLHHCLTSL